MSPAIDILSKQADGQSYSVVKVSRNAPERRSGAHRFGQEAFRHNKYHVSEPECTFRGQHSWYSWWEIKIWLVACKSTMPPTSSYLLTLLVVYPLHPRSISRYGSTAKVQASERYLLVSPPPRFSLDRKEWTKGNRQWSVASTRATMYVVRPITVAILGHQYGY